jgi:hypothetical protein
MRESMVVVDVERYVLENTRKRLALSGETYRYEYSNCANVFLRGASPPYCFVCKCDVIGYSERTRTDSVTAEYTPIRMHVNQLKDWVAWQAEASRLLGQSSNYDAESILSNSTAFQTLADLLSAASGSPNPRVAGAATLLSAAFSQQATIIGDQDLEKLSSDIRILQAVSRGIINRPPWAGAADYANPYYLQEIEQVVESKIIHVGRRQIVQTSQCEYSGLFEGGRVPWGASVWGSDDTSLLNK